MDKGVLEREQAVKVQRIISQTKSKRRQHRLLRTPQHLRAEPVGLQVGKTPPVSLSLPSPTQRALVMQGGPAPQHHPQLHINEGDSTLDEMMWSKSLYNTILRAESFLNQEGRIPQSNQCLFDTATSIENADVESTSRLSDPSERVSASTRTSPSVYEVSDRSCLELSGERNHFETNVETPTSLCEPKSSPLYDEKYLSRESNSSNQTGSSYLLQRNSSLTSQTLGYYTSWPVCMPESILCGDMDEDELFMHYLDQVFYVQYPFYHSSNRQGRGWLFSILRRVKSAYYASLALSEYYQQSKLPRQSSISSSPNPSAAKGRYYDLALQEMRLSLAQSDTWSGTLSVIRSVETLTSILQLLFWEVCLLHRGILFHADTSA